MVLGERFVLKHHFNGVPKSDDFEFVKEKLPLLKDGEILVDAKFLSVDPYLRPLSQTMNPPFTMVGSGVYEVNESKDGNFPKGAIVIGSVGWIKTGEINCSFYVLSISFSNLLICRSLNLEYYLIFALIFPQFLKSEREKKRFYW